MVGAESAGDTDDRARSAPTSRADAGRADGPRGRPADERGGRPTDEPGGRPVHGHGGHSVDERRGHPVIAFLRANPQVFVLLAICLVLGLGTFLAVVFGLLTAGSDQTTG